MGDDTRNLAAALRYASKGWAVFPCGRDKKPLTPHGFKDASADPAQVKAWWRDHPGASIGVPTGPGIGAFVLDVDLPDGPASLDRLETAHGLLPDTLAQRTGSGGRQLFFRWPEGREVRNSAGKLGPGLDVRGAGGYCIVAPSWNEKGQYEWTRKGEPAEAPAWLLDLVDPPKQDRPASPAMPPAPSSGPSEDYGRKALVDELTGLAAAQPGQRNHALNRSAFSLGQLVGGGVLDRVQVETALMGQALALGLPESEARKTIASGMSKGEQDPRTPQERAGRTLAGKDAQAEPAGPVHPVPFDELDLAGLDPSKLPPILRDFSTALAEAIQVPVELTTGMALASLAVAAQGKFIVGVKDGYAEPVNLYVVVPLEPGNRKSATVEACKRPLVDFEREERDTAKEENRAKASERKTLEKAIEARRNKAGTASPENLRALIEEIKQLEADLPEVPALPRLLCDDVTPEQLAFLMSEQGGRMGLLEAEGGILDILGGRYTNGAPNLDLFLKAHNGEPVHVDRRNAPSVRLENPCLTIGLSPQPYALTDRQAARAFRSRGLDARFLYFLPRSTVGRRTIEPPVMPPTIQARYQHKVRSILALPWAVDSDGKNVAHRLRLSHEAYRLWVDFAGDVERELADGGGLELLRDWGGKLAGAATRLAGLLHVVEHDAPQVHEIGAETMGQALYLASILAEHAKGAFQLMGSDPSHECAKAALAWIRRKGMTAFTERECFNDLRGRYQTMDELRPGLSVLMERGYIFEKQPQRAPGKAGRNPSQVYGVNPLTYSMEVPR